MRTMSHHPITIRTSCCQQEEMLCSSSQLHIWLQHIQTSQCTDTTLFPYACIILLGHKILELLQQCSYITVLQLQSNALDKHVSRFAVLVTTEILSFEVNINMHLGKVRHLSWPASSTIQTAEWSILKYMWIAQPFPSVRTYGSTGWCIKNLIRHQSQKVLGSSFSFRNWDEKIACLLSVHF